MKERKIIYKFFKLIYIPLLTILYRPKFYGKENIPKDGSIIIAGNHKHAVDPVVVMTSTKRIVHFMAKEEVSKGLHGKLFELLGIIRVYKDKTKNIQSVTIAESMLKDGGVLGIFPEGTRNRTEKDLLKFRQGAVRMAKETGALIVPFAIRGKYKVFRKGIEIEFGTPMDISNMEIEEANENLQEEVLKLLKKGK